MPDDYVSCEQCGRPLVCARCGMVQLEPVKRTYDADELGIDQEDDD